MNGPEHYREAESLLASANDAFDHNAVSACAELTALAHVHATLALAAATAMAAVPSHPGEPSGMVTADFIAWREIAGTTDEAVPQ